MRGSDVTRSFGSSLADVRKRRGLTLAGLEAQSGVGKATLSALERGEGNPTIDTVWRLARCLDVPFGALIDRSLGAVRSEDGVTVELVERRDDGRLVEAYLMHVPRGVTRKSAAHAAGVREHVLVISGSLRCGPASEKAVLSAGEIATFDADEPHSYSAVDADARAIVSVVYPREDAFPVLAIDRVHPIPPDDDWSALRAGMGRAFVEIEHGLPAARFVVEGAVEGAEARAVRLAELAEDALAERRPRGRTRFAVSTCAGRAALVAYDRGDPFARLRATTAQPPEPLAAAFELAGMVHAPDGERLSDDTRARLEALVCGDTLVTATLAAEALTRSGTPAVPRDRRASDAKAPAPRGGDDGVWFEDRIDVDAYATHELVHPAYARQALFAADALTELPEGSAIVDIGCGPGAPLQMLLELLPELTVDAVDPSPASITHLSRRFADDRRVTPVASSVADLPASARYAAAVSTGASHHLDTSEFLVSVADRIPSGAPFVVCDEMIRPFASVLERERHLLLHHLHYVLDTCVQVPGDVTENERRLMASVRNEAPLAFAEATDGRVEDAGRRVRDLLARLRADPPAPSPSSTLLAFYRLHLLELEALVAGLDYEVEMKTSPERFELLAETAGFRCERHVRLYATDGNRPKDAGTHAYLLRRR